MKEAKNISGMFSQGLFKTKEELWGDLSEMYE